MNVNLDIINAIDDYMKNPLKYALLLDGAWGSGKTYFVQNQLKNINTTYISLNGISSLNNISLQMIYQLIDNKPMKKKTILNKLLKDKDNKVIGTVGSILVSYVESKVNVSFSELIKLVGNIDFKDKLIIFDDLERCSLPFEETLGFINNLVEHNKIKVLIVANEREINKNEEYLKIKEKLIYQTLKFVPDLEELYDLLIINKDYEELINNKSFVVDELKRYNHLNIRTLQFIFQRYKELKTKIDELLDYSLKENIKKQIYNDIFKYLTVVSRDYKLGKDIDCFEGKDLISNYQLVENSYFSITSFSFVNDFILGYEFNEKSIKIVLEKYIKEISSSTNNENSTLSILNRWWEAEDDEIEKNINLIINELKENKHPFDFYPKILLYLLRINNAGFSENYLKNGLEFMKKNILNSTERVSLGYGILDASLNEDETEEYNKIYTELINIIDKHNSKINQQSTCDVKKQTVGNMGKYLYQWCMDNKNLLLKDKQFLKMVKNNNIIYIIENGNNNDVQHLVYLFNEIYNFSNVKELYVKDENELEKLNKLILKLNTDNYNKMKQFSLKSLEDTIKKYITILNQ